MKKQFGCILMAGMLFMGGCSLQKKSLTSDAFHDAAFIQDINERIDEGMFSSVLMQDSTIDEDSLQALYGLHSNQVNAYYVHLSVLHTPHEIALFQIKDGNTESIAQAVEMHVETLKQSYTSMPQYISLIDARAERQIGEYYVLIISEDAQNMMDYMENL